MSLKKQVEALLFLVDNPVGADEISARLNKDIFQIREVLSQLVQEYEDRDCALRIDTEDGYLMRVQDEYEDLIQECLPLDIRTACLRTLSVIALKEPILQAKVVEMRGGSAYEHFKELTQMDLILRKKEGHSHVLKTTPRFHKYFKLSGQGLVLQDVLKKSKKTRFVSEPDIEFALSANKFEGEEEKTEEATETVVENTEASESTETALVIQSETPQEAVENTETEEFVESVAEAIGASVEQMAEMLEEEKQELKVETDKEAENSGELV